MAFPTSLTETETLALAEGAHTLSMGYTSKYLAIGVFRSPLA